MVNFELLKQFIPLPLRRILGRFREKLYYKMLLITQSILLRIYYSSTVESLIIFFTYGPNRVDGGLLSILSIAEETARLKDIHGAEVIVCHVPGEPPLLKYTKFKNKYYIHEFSKVLRYFPRLKHLIIHIPDYYTGKFLNNISADDYKRLGKVEFLRFNMLVQNIDCLEKLENVEKLKKLGTVTCTTVHKRYTTLELREKMGVPLHRLSIFVSPEQYERKRYNEKENLMIVSHEPHPRKSEVIDFIATQFPKMKIQVIRNLAYSEYKKVVSKAKWALTFGEGLDNYFVETVFSGGISFSIYNDRFFTDEFKPLRTVYKDYDELLKNIYSDIISLDNETAFTDYQNKLFTLCSGHYNYSEYINNLKLFYKGEYDYK